MTTGETANRLASLSLLDVFERATDAMMVMDGKGAILVVNPAFVALTGFPASEVVGRSCAMLRADLGDGIGFSTFWRRLLDSGSWKGAVQCRGKDGVILPDWQSYSVVRSAADGSVRVLAVLSGILALHRLEAHVSVLRHHDSLTGLPNRALLLERLCGALNEAGAGRATGSVFVLDLDQFKLVNDSLGHEMGDRMLVQAARRLKGAVGPSGIVGRLGGDEFAVVLTGFESLSELVGIAENLLAQLLEPIHLDGHDVHVTASVGISVFPHGGGEVGTMLQNAEGAMYRVKERGRNAYGFFDPTTKNRSIARLDLQTDLRRAVDGREFILHFQPKVALLDDAITGCEALIRWRHPVKGMISPGEFIPLAEETGLILPIGLWALWAACDQGREWGRQGLGNIPIAVNLSARQFRQGDLIERIRDVIAETGLLPEHLEVELTESTVMDDAEQAIRIMKRLRDMGVRISIDDFGTGYSSLSYLRKLPLSSLKIDRSFISDMTTDADDAAIVQTIISLGRILRLDVVAEGIENEGQLVFLRDLGCAVGQGYHFAFPLPAGEFAEWLLGRNAVQRHVRRNQLPYRQIVGVHHA